MEALVYIANCLYLTSYLVKDMLRLRLLTLVAATCLMTYFYAQPDPMLTVVCWNLVFIGLNVIQVLRLIMKPPIRTAPNRRARRTEDVFSYQEETRQKRRSAQLGGRQRLIEPGRRCDRRRLSSTKSIG